MKAADVSLLALRGALCSGKCFSFLLDSGASGNFVSKSFLLDNDLDWDLVIEQKVRLADGKLLKTCGSVCLKIQFG